MLHDMRLPRLLVILFGLVTASLALSGCSWPGRYKAGLQVITGNTTASVFLDNEYLDKSPYKSDQLQPGTYQLKLEPDDPNLSPYETSITLTKGLLSVVTWKPGTRPETSGGVIYEMEPISNKKRAELSIVSLPDGVIVKLNNNPKEFTPLLIEDIEPGQHEFEVSLPSYETQKHTINVIQGYRMNIKVKLAKTEAELGVGPIATPSPSPTTEPAATTSAQPTLTQPVATASALPITGPSVTITATNFFVEGQEVLRVRDAAGSGGKELGFAPVGQSYRYLGTTEAGWYQIEFENQPGWISANFATLKQ